MPIIDLSGIEQREQFPGFRVRNFQSANMSFAYWVIDAGADLPEQSHSNEQVLNILEGEIELTIDGKSEILRPGMVAVIPSGAIHSGRTVTECKIIDVVHPCWAPMK